MKLGVNIDHVATLRQARREQFPDPVTAALICEMHGADGITCHLREDRRHIQDRDLHLLRKTVKTRLNLEMAATAIMIKIALSEKPEQVTLVPEKREEITTEGGLDVAGSLSKLKKKISELTKKGILVSMFIDPEPDQIIASHKAGAQAVELHTGAYAAARNEDEQEQELVRIAKAAFEGKRVGLRVFAGHGLDYFNVEKIRDIREIEEVNIGFAIVARAVMVGLPQAVSEMRKLVRR